MGYISVPNATGGVQWVNLIPYPKEHFQRGACWVYLVRSQYTGLYKIGFTHNVKQRMVTMPVDQRRIMLGPFRLIHTISTDRGRYLELQLHLLFSHRHSVQEWFRLTQADVDWLIALGTELPEGVPVDTDIVPPLAADP